ncbi:MAG: aldo/keto reductase [Planctomycetaceae bacterium]|nr:aldo/keto reductase [Planctomycetaceae bacterium]
MKKTPLGKTGLNVSPIGFGSFKIGRNQKTKYPTAYDRPSDQESTRLLNAVLDLGINLIDTAPAYGLSEERIGAAISHRRDEFVLATKTGECFEDGESVYDYSGPATRTSIERSLRRLKTDVLDIVYIHSDGRDEWIQNQTDVVETLQQLKTEGLIRSIGFSGKDVAGVELALSWADLVMAEYHIEDTSHAEIINKAAELGIGVVVKKGLASGHLTAEAAIRFVLENPNVSSMVIGGLNLEHLRSNCEIAQLLNM